MTSDGEVEVLAFGRPSKACACPPRRPPPPQVLFRPLAELCITAAVCNIIDAKEARDISKSGHPDMVMLTQLEEGAVVGAAVPSPPVKAASDKAAADKAAADKAAAAKAAAAKEEGRRIERYANGDVYEGEWKAGKAEGRGIFRSANGNVYEGEYKADKEEGQGTYLHADGHIAVGFFKAGTRVGEGVRWTADGRSAWQLQDGKVVKTISLEEAERRVERLGLPMPVRREGKWAAGQRG
jgi:hypothetical protein